jgi:dihydroneopterin aldolase
VITIVLRNVAFDGRHGVSKAEHASTRRFEVDVEIDLVEDAGQSTDRLNDTLDYTHIAETIVKLGTAEPCHLIEFLGRRMVEALARLAPTATIRLELRKLKPPGCPGSPAFSAVRLTHVSAGSSR